MPAKGSAGRTCRGLAGGPCECGGHQELLFENTGWDRLSEVVALPFLTSESAQELTILGPFDTLGDDAEIQPPREIDDRGDDRPVLRGCLHGLRETLVDL